MRIAISGAHGVGKSSLLAELAASLPDHQTVDEPYAILEEEGHEFAEAPSLEDFELQLERSIESLSGDEPNIIFDRCPADFLVYAGTHADAESFDLDDWLPRATEAIETLDLIVLVPIESPDRIPLPASEDREWRAQVDERLRELLADGFAVDVLEVRGTLMERVRAVLANVSGR